MLLPNGCSCNDPTVYPSNWENTGALLKRFENYLSRYDFIGAERLKVQIRKNKFAQLISESDQNLYKTSYNFETEKVS